jgi:hypothetical protein
MEEYIQGKGIVTPAATITASQQLLSQPHCTTFDNCVMGIVPNGTVTTVQEVQQIYEASALTFMDGTAWHKQKRYMASGSIQKPKSWYLQQVATRLMTLNRYLPYLPGTAQSFTEDDMKDMLVDMRSPAYHHLMARANYDVNTHSYLEITQYLQNLGLIKESFNKGNAQHNKQGNSKPKAHKAHKHQKKHGKNQCRKHPNHDHTWADCFDNLKGRGNKNATHNNNNNGNKSQVKKAEARVLDVDLDADMARTLTTINLNEEVSSKTVELQD